MLEIYLNFKLNFLCLNILFQSVYVNLFCYILLPHLLLKKLSSNIKPNNIKVSDVYGIKKPPENGLRLNLEEKHKKN